MGPNLVINPGFEQYTQCPFNGTQIRFAFPWDDCVGGNGSSDYYNTCSTNPYIYLIFNFRQPRSGNGMAGIYMFGTWIGDEYREYIMGVLTDSLKKQKRYCGELYTGYIICKQAVENIGMYFSVDTVSNYSGLFALVPQIENHKGILKDTINWVKVVGSFIAKGGEKHITIGNFKDNSHTNFEEVFYSPMGAYYCIDDVSVCECSFDINLGQDTVLCEGDTKMLSVSLPNATFTWQDSSHAATYEVKQPGTYWVRAYVAEYGITTSDTIVISAEREEICYPTLVIPNFMSPNGDNMNDYFQLGNLEYYDVSLQIFNRWGNLLYQNDHYKNDYNCNGCATGVYYYLISTKSLRNGKVKDYHGSLTVLH
ncbi:MAG: gliding motility-associated C-terminal domain-containing protein [Bacteroidetes bacterium]|nr:gliding motility-associated C-terminal domain-containing protein [Bacteroidota bacterium]